MDWHLKLWGESKDASKAKVLPMPTEEDDDDHDVISTTTLPASTMTLPPNPAATESGTVTETTDQPRPVNTKPTGTATPEPGTAEAQNNGTTTWLPSFLPNLGVSASTQAWIYGSLGLIVIFCCALGLYLWIARRKRLRNGTRGDYEFELLDEEEAEGLNGGGEKAGFVGGRKKTRKTRGGELYDAFAGGSEDEDDLDAEQYHDRSDDGGQHMSEKRGLRDDGDSDEEQLHHVIGDDDDDDDDEEDGGDRRPLHSGGR